MPPYDPKDPWGTGQREAYRPPPPPKRVIKKEEFNFFRLLKTLLTIAVLLLAANYVWKNYLNSGR
jgi:hypothetical protein